MPQKTPQNDYLTRKEERKLIRAGQKGCVESRNRVVMNIYYLIMREVGRYRKLRSHREDAINWVITILLDRFNTFDLKHNVRYSTYATYWIRKALQRFQPGLIHVPQAFIQPTKEIRTSRWFLENEEFVARSKRIASIEPSHYRRSTNAFNRDRLNFEDQFISREAAPFEHLAKEDDSQLAREMLNSLPARDREVLLRRCNGERLREIGDEFGLTRERVRQIEFKSIKLLRQRLEAKRRMA